MKKIYCTKYYYKKAEWKRWVYSRSNVQYISSYSVVLLCRHLMFYTGKNLSTNCSFCLSVNNAGYGFFSAVECVPISMAQDMFNVNFFGTLRLIKAVLPSMKAKQSGHIINNTSMAGIVGLPFMDIYSASKFAVEGLSESLAPLLRQFDIR